MSYTRGRAPRYTPEEDSIIMNSIKESPSNLNKAFDIASLSIDRDPNSIAKRYYNRLRNDTPLLAIGSGSHQMLINTKNTPRNIDDSLFNARMRDVVLQAAFGEVTQEALIKFILQNLSSEEKATLFRKISRGINRG